MGRAGGVGGGGGGGVVAPIQHQNVVRSKLGAAVPCLARLVSVQGDSSLLPSKLQELLRTRPKNPRYRTRPILIKHSKKGRHSRTQTAWRRACQSEPAGRCLRTAPNDAEPQESDCRCIEAREQCSSQHNAETTWKIQPCPVPLQCLHYPDQTGFSPVTL